ncbi:YhgE/Pip domain-containing protein [Nocardioides sp. Root151]|uniref:YhgE/Pip domain-containing protein n=1 Tax=Nocardioides sp. Root151 TaxID=1736475 RepID=UPI0007024022|nr:YhgE/Pip domain-containing protein [Nocardioides sp. Root151]KQZ67396.1 ABC transporter [Nocardioides sp. Root151]
MTSLRIAWTELRRLTAGRLPKIAVLALMLVPTLYAGLYLYANHDPYANLDHVPAALVVEDTGATDTAGEEMQAGRDVADELLERKDFGWEEVSREEAEEGVSEGRYDFALAIPRDFSASLTSAGTSDPERARLQMITNDANSYLSTTIANTVTDKVRDAIATRVSKEATDTFLLGIADLRSGLLKGANGADRLVKGLTQARTGVGKLERGAGRLATGADTLADGASELSTGLGTLESGTAALPGQTRQLATGARKVANGNATVASYGRLAASAVGDVRTRYRDNRADLSADLRAMGLTQAQRTRILALYDRVGQPIREADAKARDARNKLNRLANGADAVADGNEKLAAAVPALVKGISDAHDGATKLSNGAGQLSEGATTLKTGVGDLDTGLVKLRNGAVKLRDGLRDGAAQVPTMDAKTRSRVASTIGDPVDIRSSSQAEAASYGAGLAPFFLALAAWIGGYVLFLLVRPLSQRALAANQTPLRVALGGWYTPMLLGLAQVTVMLAVVTIALDIRPVHVPTTLLFLMLSSAVFIAIIHALNALLGTAGQFLGLVMMVMQLVTAGGTFPWQTIPQPLYVLHHVLPMSYTVDGLRQLMYGGLEARVLTDVLVLAAWGIGALLVTSRVARKQRVWSAKRVRPELVL